MKLTNRPKKIGWLEYKPFLLGMPIFRGELLVSGSVVFLWLQLLLFFGFAGWGHGLCGKPMCFFTTSSTGHNLYHLDIPGYEIMNLVEKHDRFGPPKQVAAFRKGNGTPAISGKSIGYIVKYSNLAR